MKITIISDNKIVSPKNLKAEWGFSALVEGKETVLLDTGFSVAFENLINLQKPMPSKIVLSHGHYDHTSGLRPFLRGVTVYAHPDAFLPRFFEGRDIGIPFRKDLIESSAKLVEHREPLEVSKRIWALGEIPRNFETAILRDSFLIRGNTKEKDEIKDDQSLAVKTDKGVVLLLGCGHSGLRNTVTWAEEVVGDEVKFIIGGTHLIAYNEEKINEILKNLKVEFIAPCHCTGFRAEFLLAKIFGDRVKITGVGSEFEF
ncbi:MAG: MBL fold metallo-hydrolase [Archaeoglobaceae archaeon]